MYAVIELPSFALQALLRLRPALREVPVALLRGEGRQAVVEQVNRRARSIRPGCSAAQALADCPGVQLVTPQPGAEREADALLLTAAWSLSPRVEPSAPGRCTLDLTGVDRVRLPAQLERVRAGLMAQGLFSRVGVGDTPRVARYAAQTARPVCWVKDVSEFLSALPVALLDLADDESRLLADLGLRTLGAITAFPRAALTSRLGSRGDELWSRAAGEGSAPLRPAPFPVRHVASLELEDPVETLEPLLFVLRRFCDRLAAEVGQFGGGTDRMALVLTLDSEAAQAREFNLPEPTARADVLYAVLENHLASLRTEAAIGAVALEVFPARRREQQEGLFDTGLRDALQFYATLGRLAAVVGADQVGVPCRGDSHRPDDLNLAPPPAQIPERRLPAAPAPHGPLLWRLRPPVPATVELTEARPTFLVSPLARGNVAVLRRPFRTNGDWWTPGGGWTREEWDVQVGDGLYRLRHEPGGWFIEGRYD